MSGVDTYAPQRGRGRPPLHPDVLAARSRIGGHLRNWRAALDIDQSEAASIAAPGEGTINRRQISAMEAGTDRCHELLVDAMLTRLHGLLVYWADRSAAGTPLPAAGADASPRDLVLTLVAVAEALGLEPSASMDAGALVGGIEALKAGEAAGDDVSASSALNALETWRTMRSDMRRMQERAQLAVEALRPVAAGEVW